MKIISDHQKYIIMLKKAHEYAIKNVLPLVQDMDEYAYILWSWKAGDAYGCNCIEWNYEHGRKNSGHFGQYEQEYNFTEESEKTKNVH